jgi:hypothetical protein
MNPNASFGPGADVRPHAKQLRCDGRAVEHNRSRKAEAMSVSA